MYHSFLIHLSVDGHLGCFHVLAIINSAVMNIGVHVSLLILRNWCFWIVLGKTLESPLDCKEIQPVHRKGNQSWIYIGRTDAEAEAPILQPPDGKRQLIRKDPDAWKDWRQEEEGMTEDEMFGWYYRLNRHEFEQTPGDGGGQGGLVCCSPWGHKGVGHD